MSDRSSNRQGRARITRYIVLAGCVAVAAVAAGLLGLEPFDLRTSDSSRAAGSERRAPAVRKEAGRLDRLVYDLVASMYDHKIYRPPSEAQTRRLGRAYSAIRAGRLARAAALAAPLGYEVVRFRDRPARRSLVMLRERRPRRRGWGLYVHSPRSESRLVVEISHPGSDIKTERVGVEVFRRANASDLFVAGALRYAGDGDESDVAHADLSPFEAVHRALLRGSPTILQPHGFDSGERGKQFGEIVVSSGEEPNESVRALAVGMRAAGFATCLYEPGHCEGLGATTNVQGASTRGAGATFVHIELALRLRERAHLRARIVQILAANLR